jgi:CheY-like chemotaxis protein
MLFTCTSFHRHTQGEAVPAARSKILVIEDERDVRIYLANLLAAHGFEVLTAGGSSDGLAKALAERPALIILDAMLPGEESVQLYHLLKSDAALKAVPVAVMSSVGRRALERFHHWPGAGGQHLPAPEALLVKPPEAEDVIAAVAYLLLHAPDTCKQEDL